MGINGGGYTFLSSSMIVQMKSADIGYLFRRRNDILLRTSNVDGTQPYTVITQYTNTGGLSVQLSSYQGYTCPQNVHLGKYLFLSTLPQSHSRHRNNQGIISNGKNVIFRNCDGTPNNYFAFFPNPEEKAVSHYHNSLRYETSWFAVDWRKTAKRPHSGRRNAIGIFLIYRS